MMIRWFPEQNYRGNNENVSIEQPLLSYDLSSEDWQQFAALLAVTVFHLTLWQKNN
jgi:hypothetical protein